MIAGNDFHFIVCEFAPFLPDHAFDWIPVPCDLIMVHDLYILYRFIQDLALPQDGAQSTLYSVVLPSKCSLSASASARVWWTTPSR